ncbi:hypothetical protein BU17DRAFT_93699 [Hysterangium stoloniferum]|nr:hypothetical protein BU17DRAFT_93699 [Hysterangium stoloniferum]
MICFTPEEHDNFFKRIEYWTESILEDVATFELIDSTGSLMRRSSMKSTVKSWRLTLGNLLAAWQSMSVIGPVCEPPSLSKARQYIEIVDSIYPSQNGLQTGVGSSIMKDIFIPGTSSTRDAGERFSRVLSTNDFGTYTGMVIDTDTQEQSSYETNWDDRYRMSQEKSIKELVTVAFKEDRQLLLGEWGFLQSSTNAHYDLCEQNLSVVILPAGFNGSEDNSLIEILNRAFEEFITYE